LHLQWLQYHLVPTTSLPSSSPAVSIEDIPIKVIGVLTVVIAQKLKKKVYEVPPSKLIKEPVVDIPEQDFVWSSVGIHINA